MPRAKSGSALSRLGSRKAIRSMEINRNCHITRCRFTSGNRRTLPQCGKEGVICRLLLVTINDNDEMLILVFKSSMLNFRPTFCILGIDFKLPQALILLLIPSARYLLIPIGHLTSVGLVSMEGLQGQLFRHESKDKG